MEYVTLPPKAPKIPSAERRFARPALVARHKLEDSTATKILTRLWHKSYPACACVLSRKDMNFYISVTSEGHQVYRFRSNNDQPAFLHVFRDYSALLFERLDEEHDRFVPYPLKMNRTYRRHDEATATFQVVNYHRSSVTQKCKSLIDKYASAYIDTHYPREPGPIQEVADDLHAQFLSEARWWLENAPAATFDKPPLGLAFGKAGPGHIEQLKAVAGVGYRAAFSDPVVSSIETANVGRLIVRSPYLDNKGGSIVDFKVSAEGMPAYFPSKAEYKIAKFIARAITAHPQICQNDFLAQETEGGTVRGHELLPYTMEETPSAHEAMQAYQELLSWEGSSHKTQESDYAD